MPALPGQPSKVGPHHRVIDKRLRRPVVARELHLVIGPVYVLVAIPADVYPQTECVAIKAG
jgi:hypothetical protein